MFRSPRCPRCSRRRRPGPDADRTASAKRRGGAADPAARAAMPPPADSGDERRRASPGGGAGLSLTGEALAAFARNVATAAERIRDQGFEPTFHHHVGTYVETPDEIDAFLD